MVPFCQTSWQGLAVDANAMLNWRGSSIVPLMAIRAPLSEISTTLQSRLAKPPSITCAGKSRFMRRSARFWLLKNLTLRCPRIRHDIKPDTMIRSAVRIALCKNLVAIPYWRALEVELDRKANGRIRLNCHSKDQRGAASSSWSTIRLLAGATLQPAGATSAAQPRKISRYGSAAAAAVIGPR
jgi:hypothetical protein